MTKEELKQEAAQYYEDETEGTFQICEDCHWFADAVQTAYVDSAEPREKRIAELELKIKHLTQHLEPQAMTALFEQVEEEVKQEQKIEILEKENAELKEALKNDKVCKCSHYLNFKDLEKENAELQEQVKVWKALQELYDGKAFKWQGKYDDVNKQLTKAKETLKSISELASELYASGYSSKKLSECIQDKIEQFLSEVEK